MASSKFLFLVLGRPKKERFGIICDRLFSMRSALIVLKIGNLFHRGCFLKILSGVE